MENIIYFIKEYLAMKEHFKEYNKENLYDVFQIFYNEVAELIDEAYKIDKRLNKTHDDYVKEIINDNEENLVNEIADVILTTARLIKEFKLEEPLTEMMEYKYHRQMVREENNKNERLK